MTTINLREFFYWYKVDEFIKVTDEVAQELRAGKVEDVTHWRRLKRNKANYSLDAGDGIEYEACEFDPSPEEFLARAVTIQRHYLMGMSILEVALAENVSERAVQISIDRGLKRLRKIF